MSNVLDSVGAPFSSDARRDVEILLTFLAFVQFKQKMYRIILHSWFYIWPIFNSYDIWLTSCSVSLWTSRWMLVFSFQHHQVYDWIFEVESMKIIEIQVLQHPSELFVLGAYKASWSIEMTCQVEHARFSCPICLEQASRDCWLLHGVNMLCIFHQAMCVSGS